MRQLDTHLDSAHFQHLFQVTAGRAYVPLPERAVVAAIAKCSSAAHGSRQPPWSKVRPQSYSDTASSKRHCSRIEIEKAAITVSRGRHTRVTPVIKNIGHACARPRRCQRRSTRVLRAKTTVQNRYAPYQVCKISRYCNFPLIHRAD